jgi:hypothetical protein
VKTVFSRRALLIAMAAIPLAACGKRGNPLPPPAPAGTEGSIFPRQYPAPANYPHPTLGNGTTQQDTPAEQQKPTQQDGSGDTMSAPGLYP